jgi:hypothetical protein
LLALGPISKHNGSSKHMSPLREYNGPRVTLTIGLGSVELVMGNAEVVVDLGIGALHKEFTCPDLSDRLDLEWVAYILLIKG